MSRASPTSLLGSLSFSCPHATSTFTFRSARAAARTATSRSRSGATCRSTTTSTVFDASSSCARAWRREGSQPTLESTRSTSAAARPRGSAATASPRCSTRFARIRHCGRQCAEVTLEANPDDVSAESRARVARCRRQSPVARRAIVRDAALAWMHRTHDAAQIGAAVEPLRGAGHRESLARSDLRAAGERAARLARGSRARARAQPDHISLYGLTVEPHTPLGRWRERGEVTETPEERYETEFLLAHDTLGAAGFEHYEVSNFARAGRARAPQLELLAARPVRRPRTLRARLRRRARRWNVGAYAEWLRRLAARQRSIEERRDAHAQEDRDAERPYLGLRTTDGLVLTEELEADDCPWLDAGWAQDRRRSAAAHAAGLAASGRARRRLDPRRKSLVYLHLWRHQLNERERRVLEAVIQTLRRDRRACRIAHDLAPVRARRVARDDPQHDERPRGEGVSLPSAHVRRTRPDRQGVPRLRRLAHARAADQRRSSAAACSRSSRATGTAIETILRRAAQTLGVLTQELGVALGPRLDQAMLRRLELVRVSRRAVADGACARRRRVRTGVRRGAGRDRREGARRGVARAQRAARGLTLGEIRRDPRRASARQRRGAGGERAAQHLSSRKASSCSTRCARSSTAPVLLGQASVLAEQPEFASGGEPAEAARAHRTPEALGRAASHAQELTPGISITIGAEHGDPLLGLHRRHRRVSLGLARRRDRRDRSDAHAVRKVISLVSTHIESDLRSARLTR